MISKEYDITLYVSGVVFVISLLLSFRQQIHIEDFAPYLMLLLPLAAQTFFSSYRVRLRRFRGGYRTILAIGFFLLSVHFFLLLFNKTLYLFYDNPQDHFAYKTHVVKELAHELKKQNVLCIDTKDTHLQNRLKFYGVNYCKTEVLQEVSVKNRADVTISYIGKVVAAFNVTISPK